ncbi:MAG: hypothetical protein D6710_10470 [Nitrospirae bacterium]|nr:MAG: hypothetical protein D6710_10470 [Nitrospirota bacterium]
MEVLREFYEALLQSSFFRILILLFIALFVLKLIFKRRVKLQTDSEILFSASRKRECSEYDIFKEAASEWSFSESKVKADFKAYLETGNIPRYVLDYAKKVLERK